MITVNIFRSKIYRQASCLSTTAKTIYRNIRGSKFEPEVYVLDNFIYPGSVCFDVGAAYGRYTLVMSRLAGRFGGIYSFEPSSYSYQVLSNIVNFHKLKNVTLVKQAISDKTGISRLVVPVKKSGRLGHSLAHLESGADSDCMFEEVSTVTLDEYFKKMSIPKVDFIKCDVEGGEFLVFRGARKVITAYMPVVLCEIDKGYLSKFGFTPEQIYDFFSKLGYRTLVSKDNKFEPLSRIIDNGNYFFIHPNGQGRAVL